MSWSTWNHPTSSWDRVESSYCRWFRNPRQPAGSVVKCKTRRESWDFNYQPQLVIAGFQPSTVIQEPSSKPPPPDSGLVWFLFQNIATSPKSPQCLKKLTPRYLACINPFPPSRHGYSMAPKIPAWLTKKNKKTPRLYTNAPQTPNILGIISQSHHQANLFFFVSQFIGKVRRNKNLLWHRSDLADKMGPNLFGSCFLFFGWYFCSCSNLGGGGGVVVVVVVAVFWWWFGGGLKSSSILGASTTSMNLFTVVHESTAAPIALTNRHHPEWIIKIWPPTFVAAHLS